MDFTELFVDVDDFTQSFEVELERHRQLSLHAITTIGQHGNISTQLPRVFQFS